MLGGRSSEYRLVFANAGQLVVGDVVRIGGVGVGTIKGIRLTDDSRAEVRVSVSDDYAPLHQGTGLGEHLGSQIRADGVPHMWSK